MRRAVFLDRDGTLVHSCHYPSRPDELRVYQGLEEELKLLRDRGFLLIVVTNQSGIARGYFDEGDLAAMHEHLRVQLAMQGVLLDAFYFCPHHPEGVVPELSIRCRCRKPEPGMLLQAAHDLDLDLSRSWFVGDILDDVEAGKRAGCRTILVDLGTEEAPDIEVRRPDFISRNTQDALRIIMLRSGGGLQRPIPLPDLHYKPESWKVGTVARAPATQERHQPNSPWALRRRTGAGR